MLLHPMETWLRGTSDIKNETGCQSFIEVNGNERLGLKQQLVLGHSASKARGQAVCKPWSPQKQDMKSRKPRTACQVCHIRAFLQQVAVLDTLEPKTSVSEGHRAEGGASAALRFRRRPAELDQDY